MTEAALPGISVVVTCYNCRDYIGDAIRSVARQTLSDFECVIVDDASTDDSAEVVQRTLDELADPRFSLIRLRQERRPDRRHAAPAWRRRGPPSSASSIPTTCGIPISSSAISPPT